MIRDSLTYNPHVQIKDSLTWFKQFILLQDEAPAIFSEAKEDSAFLKHRIVQVKIEKPASYEPSLFRSHALKPSAKAAPTPVNHIGGDWVFIVVVACFLLFANAQYGYFRRMQQIFKAFFANRFFNQLSRDVGLFGERVSIFLFSSYLLGFSLFIYQAFTFFNPGVGNEWVDFLLFLKILGGVFLFYLLKFMLFNMIGFIFRSKNEASDYLLNIYIYGQIAGIVLLPLILLVSYVHSVLFIYIGSALISLLYVYRLYRGVSIITSNVKVSIYYIFLYLCTLEILPFIVLIKLFTDYIG